MSIILWIVLVVAVKAQDLLFIDTPLAFDGATYVVPSGTSVISFGVTSTPLIPEFTGSTPEDTIPSISTESDPSPSTSPSTSTSASLSPSPSPLTTSTLIEYTFWTSTPGLTTDSPIDSTTASTWVPETSVSDTWAGTWTGALTSSPTSMPSWTTTTLTSTTCAPTPFPSTSALHESVDYVTITDFEMTTVTTFLTSTVTRTFSV